MRDRIDPVIDLRSGPGRFQNGILKLWILIQIICQIPEISCGNVSRKIIPPVASERDIVIVPAIAYNDEGIRLGQGGGYYDRLWKDLGGDSPDRKNVIVGICYDFQMISSIPVDENDMVCDVIFAVPTEEE